MEFRKCTLPMYTQSHATQFQILQQKSDAEFVLEIVEKIDLEVEENGT